MAVARSSDVPLGLPAVSIETLDVGPDVPAAGLDGLLAMAGTRPDAVAVVWQDRQLTYAELGDRVARGGAALRALGVEPGDRVGIVLGNVPAFVEVWFGTRHAGGVAVPLNPALAADELRHALADAQVRVVVAGTTAVDDVLSVAHEVPGLRGVIAVGLEAPGGTAGRWSEIVAGTEPGEPVARRTEDLAAIVYTSGTTGRPRGAMLTHAQLEVNQRQSLAGRVGITQDDRVLVVLPISHIYALNVGVATTLRVGGQVVLQERFDPTSTLELIQRAGVSVLLGAPPMYAAWSAMEVEPSAFAGVRVAVSGASALSGRLFRQFREHLGLAILEGYGLTEAAPSVASNALADEPRPGSVGLPLPGIEVRLVDPDGHDVEQGDPGEVLVRGPNVFSGYWDDEQATAEAIDGDGWLHTGDVAVQDEDGFLFLVDRRKDLILVSGFNVYPREVERVLLRHPGVADAAVIGVPHPYTGEAVKAFVVAADPDVGSEDLTAHCRTLLARYKCPESIELVDALPLTATGKVRRGSLRDARD